MTERIPDYSIVMPVYFNEGELRTTFEGLEREVIAKNPDLEAEVVFVDDGSGDGSLDELLELHEEHPDIIRVIKLTRNFGQPSARLCGLSYARGRCVVSMSADGQDPAELVHQMVRAHFDEGHEVVICARKSRDESLYRTGTSRIFYGAMRSLRFQNMPNGGFDFVLLGRKALEVILNNREANPFFQGQVLWTGFTPKIIEYRRLKRKVGRSRWSFGKKLKLMIDAILCYSYAPVRLISICGISMALFGFLAAIFFVTRKLYLGTMDDGFSAVEGWTALIVVILVTSGMQMLMIGILGEYQWRTLSQSRGRDPFVVEQVYDLAIPPTQEPSPQPSPGPPSAPSRGEGATSRPT